MMENKLPVFIPHQLPVGAESLRLELTEEQLKPGDLVFFKGTY